MIMDDTCVVLCFQPLLTPHHSSHSTLLFIHARARNPPARSRCVSLRERRVRVQVRRSLLALVLARVHCHEVCGRHRRLVATRTRYRCVCRVCSALCRTHRLQVGVGELRLRKPLLEARAPLRERLLPTRPRSLVFGMGDSFWARADAHAVFAGASCPTRLHARKK